MRTCDKESCERKHLAQGLCKSHYEVAKRTGRIPTIVTHFRGTIQERLEFYSERSGDCIVWTGGRSREGYGKIRHPGRGRHAHQVAYELAHGPVPLGHVIDHRCRNRACINPDHLRPATAKTNAENLQGPTARNSTGYLGVSRAVGRNKYRAAVKHHGVNYFLGNFDTAEEAGEACKAKRLELFTHNDADRAPHYDAPTETGTQA